MKFQEINTKNYITKSNLPDADYVINPYGGCPHKCIYCYAEFMKRFTNHIEEWGEYVDVKKSESTINFSNLDKKATILIGSVTDAYNPFECKYKITRNILEQLVHCESKIEILTKSSLVVRDIDIISQIKDIKVGISLNTLDENFRQKTELRASSVGERINALKTLQQKGISTYLFMSPIFPKITNFQIILEKLKGLFDHVCFENLNLKGSYLPRVLNFIKNDYPEFTDLYNDIYKNNNFEYWEKLKLDIVNYCENNNLSYKIYFYHDKIKKNAK